MMGLLDALLSGMTGPSAGTSQPGANPLLQLALQLLSSQGQFGGLSGLAQQFQQAGLGPQMNSWISSGQNLPISPEQLMQVFGQQPMQQMASSNGMDLGQLSGGLADLLPQMIDGLTPGGEVPAAGIDSALAELSNMMPRG
jgi:uncharacterized protein YidB (DUF937 family)